MRVKITRNVMINGEPVKAGSFVEVDQSIATLLITGDKAKVAPKEEPKPELEIQQKPVSRRGRQKKSSAED